MLYILVKKQLAEIFRSFFYDPKRNKARTLSSKIIMIVLFAFLMIGILGGMFFSLAMGIRSIITLGYGWFYYIVMGLVALFLGVFGSVFNTYSTLYLAKDNDLLLSMPIPIKDLIASRLVSVYIMGLMYSAIVCIPSIIVYFTVSAISFLKIIGCLSWLIVISIFVFALSCLLGYVVAQIATRLKRKNIVTVFVSVLFLAIYYVFYAKAIDMMQELVKNTVLYGQSVKNSAYPLYLFGTMAEGSIVGVVGYLALSLLIIYLLWHTLSYSFLKIATMTKITTHTKINNKTFQQHSHFKALLNKEFGRFMSSANYMLNCGLAILFMPIAGIALIIKSQEVMAVMNALSQNVQGALVVLACSGICMLASMNDMAAPSMSLEGKNAWIIQSLPVDAKMLLKAKACMQYILTGIPVCFLSICVMIAFKLSFVSSLIILIFPQLYCLLTALFASWIGMMRANLQWTNELYPIKQSLSVTICLFGGWGVSFAIGLLYMYIGHHLGAGIYLLMISVLLVLLSYMIIRYFDHHGNEKLMNMHQGEVVSLFCIKKTMLGSTSSMIIIWENLYFRNYFLSLE